MAQEEFVKKLKKLMNEKHVSGYQLGKTTNISRSYVYKLLRGDEDVKPKISTLNEFAKGLHVSNEYMYKLAEIDEGDDKEPIVEREKKDGHHVFRWQGKEISESDWNIIQGFIERITKDGKDD